MRGLCYFYLSILTQVSSSTFEVTGLFGHNVTLPCRYDALTHGVLSFCWGRGLVPMSKCSNTILSSEDGDVIFRVSTRYQLLGRVADGDVSLTILDAQWSDDGIYGCRLEIPGWFNDEKVNTHLVMEEGSAQNHPDILTTSVTKNDDGGQTLDITGVSEEKFKAFQEVENIGRVAAVFFVIIILILIFVFRKRFLPKKTLQNITNSTADNIYEVSQC